MFVEIQGNTLTDNEDMFELALNVSNFHKSVSHNMSSRQKLKATVNTAFNLADKIGDEGVSRLEETIAEFNQWCSSKPKLETTHVATGTSTKQTYEYMSQENYDGSAERAYNTHHM